MQKCLSQGVQRQNLSVLALGVLYRHKCPPQGFASKSVCPGPRGALQTQVSAPGVCKQTCPGLVSQARPTSAREAWLARLVLALGVFADTSVRPRGLQANLSVLALGVLCRHKCPPQGFASKSVCPGPRGALQTQVSAPGVCKQTCLSWNKTTEGLITSAGCRGVPLLAHRHSI